MSAPDRIARAARMLADLRIRARGTGVLDDLPEDARPRDLMEAYAVQAQVRAILSTENEGPQVGWKIGCTTPVMQEYLKIPHPCAGTLYRDTVYHNRVTLAAADYFSLGLECEIAVQLDDPLPLKSTLYTRDDVAAAIGTVMASIEIVEHRFRDFNTASTPSLVADDFFSAGCVVGAPVPVEDAGDLGALVGGFAIDGAEPEITGTGSAILGNPLSALSWLADHAAMLGTPLGAGQIVSLGSVVKTIYPSPGQRIEARFTGLPVARVAVT